MQQFLLDYLRRITEEEQRILDGDSRVNKDLYTSDAEFTVDCKKMLEEGKLIAIRPHTRFVHFPNHKHNYVEVLYVCQGRLTNIIDGRELVIGKGELLFLNQHTSHEILPAGEDDIAINFILLPEFFDFAVKLSGYHNVLADFVANILKVDEDRGEYLHFKVADVLQIQNLLENMIYALVTRHSDQDIIHQMTMAVIFLHLLDSVQYVEMRVQNTYDNMITLTVLDYIEQNYRNASLTNLSESMHLPLHVLSKMIKKSTGFNFKELLQRKRLNKAVELLCETDLSVNDIIVAVGYENSSYFHRVFRERYHTTPRAFRIMNQKGDKIRL